MNVFGEKNTKLQSNLTLHFITDILCRIPAGEESKRPKYLGHPVLNPVEVKLLGNCTTLVAKIDELIGQQ